MPDYKINIGVFQGDITGSDYLWNIGVSQTDAVAAGSIVPFTTSIAETGSVSTAISEMLGLLTSVQAVSITEAQLRSIVQFYTVCYGIGSVTATLGLVAAAIQSFSTSIYATSGVSAILKKLSYLINILSSTGVNPLFASDSADNFLIGGDIEVQSNAYAPLIEALLRFALGNYQGIDTVFTAAGGTVVTTVGGIVVGLS